MRLFMPHSAEILVRGSYQPELWLAAELNKARTVRKSNWLEQMREKKEQRQPSALQKQAAETSSAEGNRFTVMTKCCCSMMRTYFSISAVLVELIRRQSERKRGSLL